MNYQYVIFKLVPWLYESMDLKMVAAEYGGNHNTMAMGVFVW